MEFLTIQGNIRVPLAYVEFDNSQSNQGLAQEPNSILIIGQTANAGAKVGTTANGVISPVTGGADGEAQFGRGSMLAEMIWALFNAQPNLQVYAIGLADNGAGVAATGKITITGPATGAGTLALYIGGVAVPVAVAAADTADAIATNVAAAINANQRLPVTAAVNGVTLNEVDLTCPWKGVTGDDIDLRTNYYPGDALPAGVAAAFVAMAGGTENPDITSVITAMGDSWYDVIALPYTDAANYAALNTELTARWGGMRQIDATAYAAIRGSYATILTYGGTVNSPYFDFMEAGKAPQPAYIWAAVDAAQNAFEKQTDPNRPRQTVTLPGILPPAIADRFTWAERNNLLYNGISTHSVDRDGTVRIERQITSYQTNPQGVADPSYLQQEKMDLLSFLRYDTRFVITNTFPRSKLAVDGTPVAPGQAIVTPSVVRAKLIERATDWLNAGYIEDIQDFIAGLVVQINATDPTRLDVLMDPSLVNGLNVFAAQIQFKN